MTFKDKGPTFLLANPCTKARTSLVAQLVNNPAGEGIGYPLQYPLGFTGGSDGKKSALNVGDLGSIHPPWSLCLWFPPRDPPGPHASSSCSEVYLCTYSNLMFLHSLLSATRVAVRMGYIQVSLNRLTLPRSWHFNWCQSPMSKEL